MFLGNDGGLYHSTDRGDNTTKVNGLPITQFYTSEIDFQQPHRLYGGTQDNGTIRTLTGGVNAWSSIYGGDGFRVRVDPTDSRYVYAEFQYGGFGRSVNGGNSFSYGLDGVPGGDRKNWNTPYILDPVDPSILYLGTQRLYKSENRAESWNDVSASLPARWVTSVMADPTDPNAAYVTFSGFRYGEQIGHVYKTENAGDNWIDISGDFPDIPVNAILVIPTPRMLCIATDIGVYTSTNDGISWELPGTDLPNLIITDLTWHSGENFLVAATYGRGMYKLDLNKTVSTEVLSRPIAATVYPNPFSTQTAVRFNAGISGNHTVSLYNTNGRLVRTLHSGHLARGAYEMTLDGTALAPGIYVCVISSVGIASDENVRIVKIGR
jgi:hypothetical protein